MKKKQEEAEAKEERKKEREEKKKIREEEAKKKAEERERKAIARQEEANRKTELKERKAAERKEKELEKRKKVELRQNKRTVNKENLPGASGVSSAGGGDQQNECSVCLGMYNDDVVDGVLQTEWLCCTSCSLWMHQDCVASEGNTYVCVMCNASFQ